MNPITTNSVHRVWRLPANLDTDVLAPGIYMQLELDEIASHCLESVRPEFASQVRPGDVIVAGPNFGVGSSREQAAGVLRHLGVAAILAPSFAGLFYRNALNLGLTALVCDEAEQIEDGQSLRFGFSPPAVHMTDAQAGLEPISFEPLPGFLQEMVDAGGLLEQLRQRLNKPGTNS